MLTIFSYRAGDTVKELAFETPVESGVETEATWSWSMFTK